MRGSSPKFGTIEITLAKESEWITIIWVCFLAVLGGFILNFMPCVLPVLSLKIISFLKDQNINRKTSSLLTIAGIFTSFWGLAAFMIFLKNSGKQFGLGINFQLPEFVIILTVIITIFISSAMGRFNLNIPSSLSSYLHRMKFNNQYLEYYFSGILVTILSTPCNAPFLGTAIALSFATNSVIIFLIFTFIAFGLSIPYILLILYPPLLTTLPKPGVWMEILKKILVLLLVGTLFWLLYVLHSQIGQRAVLGLFMLLLLLKFSIENDSRILRRPISKLLLVASIIVASIILPQYSHKEDATHDALLDATWKEFDPNLIKSHVEAGRVVFVDITADWCISCKYNKFMVLNQNRTISLFQRNKIVALRGDYTSDNTIIYNYLVSNNVYGVPFYKVYGPAKPDGIVLPVILSFSDVKKAISNAL